MSYDLKKVSDNLILGSIELLHSHTFFNGRKFPQSYINFVENYGYGLSCDLFIIYIPMENYPDSFFIRSQEIIGTYQEVLDNEDELWFDMEPDLSYKKLKDLIPFAMSENGHYLFWDIESENSEEFDIYITDFKGLGFTKTGGNLYDFFEKLTPASARLQRVPYGVRNNKLRAI
ncbi:SMI1/KNR4 family protein [Zobellia sp. 1_MG-2023]|uniref:SMI1/KNR4 family protein n=1 Tax=Zobellia sp. 1_MG-2023 TaxID=3062626 RepID=UPI0026E17814|nr:SMI1/KNR4 family protein [Zobellia sp. 1_MG-2023]MDO6819045.1 SMI1/KNR4 family protein [Zobellia sp. 1_MG-2023]